MKLLKFLSVFCVMLYSCNNSNDPVLSVFKDEVTLSPTKIISLEKYDVLKPVDILKINEDYLIRDDKTYNLFSKINFTTNMTVKGINKGNGPNEVNLITSMEQYEDNILIYDTSKRKIFTIYFENDSSIALKEKQTLNTQNRSSIINYVNYGLISSGMFKDFWIGFFDEYDKLKSSIDFPTFKETQNLRDIQKSIIFVNTLITVHPRKNKFVAATMKCGVLSFCEVTEDKKINEYSQIKYYTPQFSIVDEVGNIAYDKEYNVAFCDIDCSNDKVFVLYSGRSFKTHGLQNHHCEHLLIYDWNGNAINHYKLDVPMYSMRYDNENKSIYGIGFDPEGVFLEYKLE